MRWFWSTLPGDALVGLELGQRPPASVPGRSSASPSTSRTLAERGDEPLRLLRFAPRRRRDRRAPGARSRGRGARWHRRTAVGFVEPPDLVERCRAASGDGFGGDAARLPPGAGLQGSWAYDPAYPSARPRQRGHNVKGRPLGAARSPRCLGSDLLSHPVARAVPSALEGLTSGFGMGPGVPPPPWPPKRWCPRSTDDGEDAALEQSSRTAIASASKGQVLGLLVRVSSTRCRASTSRLSTWWSSRALTWSPSGRPHLRASFALRCFQRLSLPNVANQPCRWRDNWHTRGSSAPVLSY